MPLLRSHPGERTDPDKAAQLVDEALGRSFSELQHVPAKELVASRYNKFRKMAQFFTEE